MTNKIMELADKYSAHCQRSTIFSISAQEARTALAAEVQAHIDYTLAVIAERDALRKAAHKVLAELDSGTEISPESAIHITLRKELGE